MLDETSIDITDGELTGDESWVYVWLSDDGGVIYVGSTRLPLGARTWLHLTEENPRIGRIRAEHPEAMKGHVTVRGWRLPQSVDRSQIRDCLAASLVGDGLPENVNPEVGEVVRKIEASIRE